MDLGTEGTLGKGAEGIKMHSMVNTDEGRAAFQRDLDWLQKWTDQKLMRFIKNKCQVLSLARTSPMQQCILGTI